MLNLLRSLIPILLVAAAPATEPYSMSPLPEPDWSREHAEHLLRRAGFHGTPADVARLAELGREPAVAALLDTAAIEWRIAAPAIAEELYRAPERRQLRDLSAEERREKIEDRRRMEREAFVETRLWWLERLASSPRVLEEKLTLFWHGHFTSGMREVRDAVFMKEQNDFLRRNALGSFEDLLTGISRDRAMLVYLDGRNNSKKQPNENYARELLELFSLGVGNYTESDVKAAARAFTGWTMDRYGFTFRAGDHDEGVKKFLGREGNLNGDDVIDQILKQPACARYLSGRILRHFVTPEPERRLIESFATVLKKNNFELKPALRTLFNSQAFYHANYRGALIKSPVEVVVGTARSLGQPLHDLQRVERALIGMGQELLQPPNVRGWAGHEAWINTATLFNRYNTAAAVVNGDESGRPAARRRMDDRNDEETESPSMQGQAMTSEARSRRGDAKQPSFDPGPWLRDYELTTAEATVDFFAGHLLAVELSDAKREQLIAFLRDGKPAFDPRSAATKERVRALVTLICSTPEYQLN